MEKTLREAVEAALKEVAFHERLGMPPMITGAEVIRDLRAALDRLGECDPELALHESLASDYWMRAPLTHEDLVTMQLTDEHPHLAAWLKSRERGA